MGRGEENLTKTKVEWNRLNFLIVLTIEDPEQEPARRHLSA